MSTTKSIGVNSLSFNLQALEIIARANYKLTLHDRKQRNLQQVVALMLKCSPEIDKSRIKRVEYLRPLSGEAVLGVRLDLQQQERAALVKSRALEEFGYHWQLRDVIIYLCHGLLDRMS
jgi:hypothetical protein